MKKYTKESEVGKQFGRWQVVDLIENSGRNKPAYAIVECLCGSGTKKVKYANIISGDSTSCGCFHKEKTSSSNIKHGNKYYNDVTILIILIMSIMVVGELRVIGMNLDLWYNI